MQLYYNRDKETFGARAKGKEAKDYFGSRNQRGVSIDTLWSVDRHTLGVDRHTLGVDRHTLRPSKVLYAFKFIEEEITPEDFPICIISPWTFYRVFILFLDLVFRLSSFL